MYPVPASLIAKAFAAALALCSWYPVVFPRVRVSWGRKSRGTPMSMHGRIATAVTVTCGCLAVFGFYPLLCINLCIVGVAVLLILSRRERVAHDRAKLTSQVLKTTGDGWLLMCILDGVLLVGSWSAVIRDFFYPPSTEEQRLIHFVGVGFAILTAVLAIVLYWKRPPNQIE